MFERYFAQRLPGRAAARAGSSDLSTRVLYRALLRNCQVIEHAIYVRGAGAHVAPSVTRHVQASCSRIDTPRSGLRPMAENLGARPAGLVRAAFRELEAPSLDKAFAGLRSTEEVGHVVCSFCRPHP